MSKLITLLAIGGIGLKLMADFGARVKEKVTFFIAVYSHPVPR